MFCLTKDVLNKISSKLIDSKLCVHVHGDIVSMTFENFDI